MFTIIHYFFSTLPMVFFIWGISYFFMLRLKGVNAKKSRIFFHIFVVTILVSLLSAFAHTELSLTSSSEEITSILMFVTVFVAVISCRKLRAKEQSIAKLSGPDQS